jgi:hypothetical protein
MSELPRSIVDHLKAEWPDRQRVGLAVPVSPEMMTNAAMGCKAVVDHAERRAAYWIRQRALDDGLILITAIVARWSWTSIGSYPDLASSMSELSGELPWDPTREVPDGAFFLLCRVSALAIKPFPAWAPGTVIG